MHRVASVRPLRHAVRGEARVTDQSRAQVYTTLRADAAARLKFEAERRGYTMYGIVRYALTEWLREHEGEELTADDTADLGELVYGGPKPVDES